ncbi:hypothetical protein AWC38_SpisGene9561 [Stylophora pistillata]|uniref:ISXO2-like transposase domain-containing protein n=1 Tax=Stylophora pistillata TaxID=50429 RepID=A0A2B4S535_STYPI|nr:hypothetical protein AWC38_SpisGene9561 [Stylophora pistillata]
MNLNEFIDLQRGPRINLIQWLQRRSLLADTLQCAQCNEDMVLIQRNGNGHLCGCSSCKKKRSLRTNRFFEEFPCVPLGKLLLAIHHFVYEDSQRQTARRLNLNPGLASKIYRRLQDVCSRDLDERPFIPFGGPGAAVKCDESKFNHKAKFNRGRRAARDAWVFGIVTTDFSPARGYFQVVERRDIATLDPIISKCIRPETEVYTDDWASYRVQINECCDPQKEQMLWEEITQAVNAVGTAKQTVTEAETSDKKRLKAIAASLDEKLNLVKTLDEEIIENCAVEEVEAEIEESDEINSRVIDLLLVINEATGLMDNNDGLSVVPTTNIDDTTPPGSQQSITPSGTSGTSTLASKNNVQLQSPGSAAYGGFHSFDVASTSHAENMQSSGNSACTSVKATRLRLVYDKFSINIRGLESLGVSSHQYGSLMIPVIMSKLPHEIRIQVARNTASEVWEMSDMLEVIRQEVEAREISEGVKTNVSLEKLHPNHHKTPTANPLLSQDDKRFSLTGNQIKCVYCGGLHYCASCENVSDPHAHFES